MHIIRVFDGDYYLTLFVVLIGGVAQEKVIPAAVPAAAGLLAADAAPTAGHAPRIAATAAVNDDGAA